MSTMFSDRRPMPPNEQLALAPHQRRTSGQVRVEAFHATVVERQHVVLRRLEEELALQVGQLVRVLGGQVVRLGPVVGPVQLPDIVLDGRQGTAITHGILCRVTAVQPLW